MHARTTSPQVANAAGWLAVIFGLGLLLVLLLSFVLEGHVKRSAGGGAAVAPRVAYLEFGIHADTLWLADPLDLSQRERALVVPHAAEFGIVPSLAPDRRRFAYTALPPETPAPSASTPAALWLAPLAAGAEPVRLADGVDLLVRPVWSPGGEYLVFRRSTANGNTLSLLSLAVAEEAALVRSGTSSLFPVAFGPGGQRLYFVTIDSTSGSRLFSIDLVSGAETEVAVLSPGLTRDWVLSPGGDRLAYLAMSIEDTGITSRAFVADLDGGRVEALTRENAAAFGPVWTSSGGLVVGSLDEAAGTAALVQFGETDGATFAQSERGFDVPLAFSPSGEGVIVRSFESASTFAPGPSRLTLIDASGERHTLATGEVTFVGWMHP